MPVQFDHRDPFAALAARTQLADERVITAATQLPRMPFAIAGAGGYGRRELFPCSDVDLLLIVPTEADIARLREPLSGCLRELWDSGLRIGHSVRTIEECCRWNEQNLELHVSLLDLRFLYGDREIFDRAARALGEFYAHHGRRIAARLAERTRQRHRKFDNTPYHLEPNIKETCGGIRDLHLLGWFTRLYPSRPEIAETLSDLAEARRFLFALRCFLHLESGRDNNLLSFELQDEAARRLAPDPVSPPGPVSPEDWMRQYFRHARRVFASARRPLEIPEAEQSALWRQMRDRHSRTSTAEFTVSRGRVLLRNPAITLRSAESVLAMFTFIGRHGTALSWDAQRQVRGQAGRIREAFSQLRPAWTAWHGFFSQPHCALALAAMQEANMLAAAIPEWKHIESLVVRDFYHRYTVDEHSLRAVAQIDELKANPVGQLDEGDLALLRIALLLHDIGKGTQPGDHIRGSLDVARGILDRMGAPQPARAAVLFLIEHHLDLSQTMTSRDLGDPVTARLLTSRIGTEEDLRRLVLLTYADIAAVNPSALTPWRSEQLWRVYAIARRQFTRELASERIHHAEALPAEIAPFVEGFPTRYLRTQTREDTMRHFALYRKSLSVGAGIEIRRDPHAWIMTVVAHDRPRLFASLCGALAGFGMNIVKAEAFSNTAAYVLDSIRFTDPLRNLELNSSEVNRLEWTVACVLNQTITVDDLLKRRRAVPRPTRSAAIAPSARFYQEASDTATLLEFVGEDRPGLLHDLASAIASAGCNIEAVMVDTQAHKAVDVFYVTCNRRKLDEATEERLRGDLTGLAAR
ncbi:MAG: ACT domain-containing protein [Bryobacteraceae bacterium]